MKRKIIIEARVEIPVPEDFEVTEAHVDILGESTKAVLMQEVDEGTTVETYAELREVD